MTFSCILTTCLTIWLVVNKAHFTIPDALHLLGYWPISLGDLLKTLLLLTILFLGPIFEGAVCEGNWRSWIRLQGVGSTLNTSMGWRNYVTVRPTYQFSGKLAFNAFVGPNH